MHLRNSVVALTFQTFFFILQVYLLGKDEGGAEKPLFSHQQFVIFVNTWSSPGYLNLPEGMEMFMPGEDTVIKLVLGKGMVCLSTAMYIRYRSTGFHLTRISRQLHLASAQNIYQ